MASVIQSQGHRELEEESHQPVANSQGEAQTKSQTDTNQASPNPQTQAQFETKTHQPVAVSQGEAQMQADSNTQQPLAHTQGDIQTQVETPAQQPGTHSQGEVQSQADTSTHQPAAHSQGQAQHESKDGSTSNTTPRVGETVEIPVRSGRAFKLQKGQRLTVIDPRGVQVSDLLAYNAHDTKEVISSGRTLDYASRIFLTTGDPLYSNRSNIMLRIVEDTVGRHDFLLTPCSKDTFRIIYGDKEPHHGCFGNLSMALEPYGIKPDDIPVAFNCFMNVVVDAESGELRVDPPTSKAGDHITFEADIDLIMALTACSALQSNGGSFKPIHFKIDSAA